MSTKQVDLSQSPKSLRHGIVNRSIKVKRLDRNSQAFQRLSTTHATLNGSHFIAFSHFCCSIKKDQESTFVLLGNQGQIVSHIKLNTADVKHMVHLTSSQKERHHNRRIND